MMSTLPFVLLTITRPSPWCPSKEAMFASGDFTWSVLAGPVVPIPTFPESLNTTEWV